MKPAVTERQWRWHPWAVGIVIVVWLAQKSGAAEALTSRIPKTWQDAIGFVLITAVWVTVGHWFWRALRRRERGPGHGPDDLGHPYEFDLEITRAGARIPLRLAMDTESVTLEVRDARRACGRLDPPIPDRVPLRDLRALRLRATSLVLEAGGDDEPQSFHLFPRAYADRMRFVWELAVRRPDLVETPEAART